MPHSLDTRAWATMNSRWYRNHSKAGGTVGSSLHPQKRTLAVWLSRDASELFATVWFGDDRAGWRASFDVEKGLLPACSLSFLPLATAAADLADADLRRILRGLPDGRYVVKAAAGNWYNAAAVNEISLVSKGEHPAAVLWDYQEGNPVWRPQWRGKVHGGGW
jgi:hypothetical protein